MRDKIKSDYMEKIKDKQLDINVERLRLNLLISNMKSPLRSEVMSVAVISISILASGFINAIAQCSSFYGTIIFTTLCTIVIMITYFKAHKGEPSKFFLYKLCLEILNEIEEEVKLNN